MPPECGGHGSYGGDAGEWSVGWCRGGVLTDVSWKHCGGRLAVTVSGGMPEATHPVRS
jgi:hypothetical protein